MENRTRLSIKEDFYSVLLTAVGYSAVPLRPCIVHFSECSLLQCFVCVGTSMYPFSTRKIEQKKLKELNYY